MKTGNIISPSLINLPGASGVLKLLKTVKIVTALPAILEPRTEYIVGDTNLINITGLNGNDARLWHLAINGVAIGTSTATHSLQMTFNGVTTSGAYNSTNQNVTQAGAGGVNYQASTTAVLIGSVSVINTGAEVVFASNVDISPAVVGANVFRQVSAGGAYARTGTSYGHTSSGGFWRDASSNLTSLQITTNEPAQVAFTVGTTIELLQLDK
jgi:hypothetical protein